MGPLRYLSDVSFHAFRDFSARADFIYFVISLAGALWLTPNNSSVSIPWLTLYILCVYVLIRFLFVAPYKLWHSVTIESANQRKLAESPLRQEKEAFAHIRAQRRMELLAAVRLAHFGAAHKDQDAYFLAAKNLVLLEPQAIPEGQLHTEVRKFLRVSQDYLDGNNEITYNELADCCEGLMRAIHAL